MPILSRNRASIPLWPQAWWSLALIVFLGGCASLKPSNYRDWSPDQAVLPYAETLGNRVTVHNVRDFTYLDQDSYVVHYYDKTYDLDKAQSVDFIVVPFRGSPTLAHTMLSFGFAGGEYLALSVEIRKERGEQYSPLKGVMRQYELMYVLADERDVVKLRTQYRKDDVFLYPTRATPEQARALLVDVLDRVNQLHEKPEFYNTLTNNCTTNLMQHVNRLHPHTVPYNLEVLLPGLSDQLAYDRGLLRSDGSFEQTKSRALVTPVAQRYADSPEFSARIRDRWR